MSKNVRGPLLLFLGEVVYWLDVVERTKKEVFSWCWIRGHSVDKITVQV